MHGFILVCLINSYAGGWECFQHPYVVEFESQSTCLNVISTLDSEANKRGYGKCKCIQNSN